MTEEYKKEAFGFVLNCAVRYACGRQTYAPSIVMGYIESVLPEITDKELLLMEKYIRERDYYGDEKIDKPDWLDFLDTLQAEIGRRKLAIL